MRCVVANGEGDQRDDDSRTVDFDLPKEKLDPHGLPNIQGMRGLSPCVPRAACATPKSFN
jgi:hypothetical protein